LRKKCCHSYFTGAEGHSRGYTNEYLHHIAIALGSVAELETQLEIANRLGYIKRSDLDNLLAKTAEIGRMLTGLKKSLK
jgi:four helix bundle protein